MLPIDTYPETRLPRRRGAALYLTTVFVSIMVAGMAMTLAATQRADRRIQSNIEGENQAWWIAKAGIDMGLAYTEQVSNWRSQVASNTLFSNVTIGGGKCTIQVFDDRDGNLTNEETDPVRLVSTATCNGATYKLQANLLPRPHTVLSYACFGPTSDDMEFKSAAEVRGPVRSHGRITVSSSPTVQGDASFETMNGYTIDNPLAPKSYVSTAIAEPSVNLAWYLARATPITGSVGSTCELKGYNLTPTGNPTGTPNANAIYSLDPGNRPVVIENMHLRGTLIINNAPSSSITFQKGLWVEPGPLGYPVLLLNNPNANTIIGPDQTQLVEITSGLVLVIGGLNITLGSGVDFNQDGDIADAFTCNVRGIVWASSQRLTLQGGSWNFAGTAINKHLIVTDNVRVDNDFQLQNSIAPSFVGTGMRLIPGSFKDAP